MLRGKAYLSKVRFNRLFASQSSNTNCRSPTSFLHVFAYGGTSSLRHSQILEVFHNLQIAWKVGLNDENRMMGKPAPPSCEKSQTTARPPTASFCRLLSKFDTKQIVKVHHRWKKKSLRASVKSDAAPVQRIVSIHAPQHHINFQQCSPFGTIHLYQINSKLSCQN